MNKDVVIYTDFKDLKLFRRGKVRDVYEVADNLLIVSTDRISCFDVVLPCGIPNKGKVLNKISCFWFDFIKDLVPNHLISADADSYPPELKKYKDILSGRSMLVKKTKPFAVECVVRGYLAGSGFKEYKQKQSVCAVKLPPGLVESDKLPEIIFTPSTKADVGHDMNVEQAYVQDLIGNENAQRLKDLSIAVYKKAAAYAINRGIIIADTKFEFGLYDNEIIIIDEVLTPDSSRFWPKDQYERGKSQPSFDKQFVRDYLETLNWDKTHPAPDLPKEIISKTTDKYLQALVMLTGKTI